MKLQIKRGKTSKLARIFVPDSSATDGSGLTGLLFSSGSLTWYYIKEGEASATSVTLATMTVGTWATGGFKEVDATNLPGIYEIGIPDAALSTGESVSMMLKGATDMAPVPIEIELVAYDPQDASLGMSPIDANLIQIDGAATNGYNATLKLAQLDIQSQTPTEPAVKLVGNTTGAGLLTTGGATGPGMSLVGGATSGNGLDIASAGADGISITAENTGIKVVTASSTGYGVQISATGAGVDVSAGNGIGLNVSGSGSGDGVKITGGSTGHGVNIVGGSTSGDGFKITTTDGYGMNIRANGSSKDAFLAYALGSGGMGIHGLGGSSGGSGIHGEASVGSNGHGILADGYGTGSGIYAFSNDTGNGIHAKGKDTGHGFLSQSGAGATGDGARFESLATNGNGLNTIKNGTGIDLKATDHGDGSWEDGGNTQFKKNVAFSNFPIYMVDNTNHVSGKSLLTITAEISQGAGAFAPCTNAVTEIGGGYYVIDLTQAEMNADTITLKFAATGADTRVVSFPTNS